MSGDSPNNQIRVAKWVRICLSTSPTQIGRTDPNDPPTKAQPESYLPSQVQIRLIWYVHSYSNIIIQNKVTKKRAPHLLPVFLFFFFLSSKSLNSEAFEGFVSYYLNWIEPKISVQSFYSRALDIFINRG